MIFRRKRDGEEANGLAQYPEQTGYLVEQQHYVDGYVDGSGYPVDGTADGVTGYDYAGYNGEVDGDEGYVAYAEVAPQLAELERLRGERRALIELCLYARDRVNSVAAADRIDAGLAALGITTLRPDGAPFDPGQHEAAASVPTDDPARHGTVAETEVPGYADRGVVVRPPVVSVYRREGS